MYSSKDSAPKQIRNQTADGPERQRPDGTRMARHCLSEWAIQKVESYISSASEQISSLNGGFHLTAAQTNWDFIKGFSLAGAIRPNELTGAVLLRVLAAAALPATARDSFKPSSEHPSPYFEHMSRPIGLGSGKNRRDPIVIIIITFLLLMYARNMQFSVLRKIAGIWLFANNASDSIFAVLSRIGLTSSYTTVLKVLRRLSKSAQGIIRDRAKRRAFLLIYDNINRMQRAWDPDLGQHDVMDSGTAATFIELMNCDVGKAFDPMILKAAKDLKWRKNLTVDVLLDRIDIPELHAIMALHALNFLVQDTPVLAHHQEYIQLRFRVNHAKHRMPDGHITIIHPLATSAHDEGSTQGNRDVLDDLLLSQLGMDKSEVDKLLIIVGGDQSTVEKIRTLQKFLADCPHGYSRYGWVLPLIQLWHIGWADLERILSTHWGKTESGSEFGDMSSFYFVNTILKRKIKDVKRPDYYPTQNFIFDSLRTEILDCWRVILGTNDLQQYFTDHTTEIEDLLKLATRLADLYLTTEAAEKARAGYDAHEWTAGDPWDPPRTADMMDVDEPPAARSPGDVILSNAILRLRDCLLHFEFQYAVADGDIGRAMNVMAFWTFTFPGCGKNKYANELLEVACNFQYEYSLELQNVVLDNWLCSLTGFRGSCFPMDQLQEHNIKQLKKVSERRDASFGQAFFKDVVAYNIRAFLKAGETMRFAVGLHKKGGSHTRPKKAAALKDLARVMHERQLHKFRAGRDLGHTAQNDFEEGYLKLLNGKIKDFVKKTR
ncbi:hypothetical protein C8J57DRAFT_1730455 [Mycena rebaudengoi]|nr:hypothetical protein C8J57DRAFT_1730455 [Mycena rebaudengoi]